MNIKLLEYIAQIVKNITEVSNKVADASDPKKYADGVSTLNQNIDETYAKMRELIVNDDTLSAPEKVEKLDKLAKSQQAALTACGEEIKGNRENVAKIVTEVFAALATCGVSCIPKVIGGRKKVEIGVANDVIVTSDVPVDCIETVNNENDDQH